MPSSSSASLREWEPETRGNWRYVGQVEGKWFRVVIAGDDPNVVISVHEGGDHEG
jgi:hypothetical protein